MHPRLVAALILGWLLVAASATWAQSPQVRYLEGHQGAVRDVAITSDGRMIVTGGVDGTLRLWDRLSGELLKTLPAHEQAIYRFELSPDGSALALADASGHVKLLELPRPHPLTELSGFPLTPDHLIVTQGGQQIVTGDGSEVLRLFDLASKQQVREFAGAAGGTIDIGLAVDGQQLLAASGGGHLRGWNLADGQSSGSVLLSSPSQMAASRQGSTVALAGEDGALRLASWPPRPPTSLASHGDAVRGLAMTADGSAVLSGGLDQQVLLQVEGSPVKALAGAGSPVTSVALSGDGTLAAAGTENGLVPLWKAADGTIAGVLAGHAGSITSIEFHPRRPLLASAGSDGTIRVWRPFLPPVGWTGHSQPATVLAVSSDGGLALSAAGDKTVRIWNPEGGQSIAAGESLPQVVTAATFSEDKTVAILGDAAGTLQLRQLDSGQSVWSIRAHSGAITDVALMAGGKLASAGPDGQVKIWHLSAIGQTKDLSIGKRTTALLSLADGTMVAGEADGSLHFATPDGEAHEPIELFSTAVSTLSASADGGIVVAGGSGGELALLEVAERKVQSRLTAHAGKVRAIAIHPQGSQFATVGEDGAVRQWSLPLPPRELVGHQSAVTIVAVSPNGQQAVSGDASGSLRRWSFPSGEPAEAIAGGKAALTAAAYRRDGVEVASGDAAGAIRLVNAADGAELGTIGAHEGAVTALSYHPAGTQLLSSGSDGVLRLWQLPLAPPRSISNGNEAVSAIAVNGDGSAAAIVTAGKRLAIIDAGSGQERAAIDSASSIAAVAISPDNSQAAFVTEAGTLEVAALTDGQKIAELGAHAGAATAVAFRPQGGQIATAGSDGQLRLWEVPVAPRQFGDHTGRIAAAVVSPNGQWLATASADKTVRLWNVADGTASWTLGHASGVSAIAFRPDSLQIAAAAGESVQIWNTADGQAAATLLDKHSAPVSAIAFSPDGASLYTAGKGMPIQQWTLADGKLLRTLGESEPGVNSLSLVAGGTLLVATTAEGEVEVWNVATGAPARIIDRRNRLAAAAVSGDGRWLAIADAKEGIDLYDLADGALAQRIDAKEATCLAFSGDHLSLAAGSADGMVRIWNLQGQLQEFIPGAGSPPTALAFLADHRQLAIGDEKGLVRICRRALHRTVAAANSPLTAAAWSADGQFVVTAAEDKTLKLWNAADGTLARQFFGQADVPRCVCITRDGSKVVSACDDRSLRVWNYSDGSLIATMLLDEKPKGLATSADGSRIVVTDSRRVTVWDLATRQISEWFDIPAIALAILPDGKQLLVGDAAGGTQRLTLANLAVTLAHGGGAAGAAFSQDGQRWLSIGADKAVKAWDAAGKPQTTLGACEGVPTAIAIRADGLQLAIAGRDRQIYLWRLDNNQLERKISAGAQVSRIAYHPSLPKLVAVCADGLLRVFDTADGGLLETVSAPQAACAAFVGDELLAGCTDHGLWLHRPSLVRKLAGHQGSIGALAYSSDGATLFSGGDDKTVRQWNVADGAALRVVVTAGDAITGLALSHDGSRLLAASADGTIRVHNVADGAAVASYTSPGPIRLMEANAGRRLLATAGDDGSISIWDAQSGTVRETLAAGSGRAAGMAFSTDGQRLLAAPGDGGVQAWPLACRGQFAADAAKVHDLAATLDGKHLATTGDDKVVKLWNADGQLVRPFLGMTYAARNISIRGDGKQIVAGGDATQAQTQLVGWNLEDGQTQFSVTLPSPILEVVYLDEGRIAVACGDQKLRLLSAADGKLLEERQLPAAASSLAALPSPENKADSAVVVAAADNQVYRLEAALLRVIAAHEGGATAISWSGADDELFSAGADKHIRQWNAVTGEPLRAWSVAPAAVTSIDLSDDGLRVVAGCDDQKLRIWELSAGETDRSASVPPREIAHPAAIRGLICSADGRRIVTGGEDGLVRVWDAASGKEVERFAGHVGAVLALAANGAADIVASGGADKTVRRNTALVASLADIGDGASTACTISPDSRLVFVATSDGKLAAWSVKDLSVEREYRGTSGTVHSLAVSQPAGGTSRPFAGGLLAAGGGDTHLRVWSVGEGTLLADVVTHAPITAVQFARGGRLLVVGGTDGVLRHYELSGSGDKLSLELSLLSRGHVGAIRRLVVPADDGPAFSVAADGKVFSWRLVERRPRWQHELERQPIGGLAFRPDGQTLVVGGVGGVLRELSIADGSVTKELRHDGGVLAVAFRPDGQELATAGTDGIYIWNGERQEAAHVAIAPAGAVQAIEWSADGALLQVGGQNRLWQTFVRSSIAKEPPSPPRHSEGHNHPIVALRYSANRQRIATLDDSGKLFVWDAASGNSLFHQQIAVTAAYDLAWSPDASEIVLATSDSRVLRVNVPAAAR